MRCAEAFADLGEMVAEGGVSGEVDDAALRFDGIAAPQASIAVEKPTRGKVQRGHAVNLHIEE